MELLEFEKRVSLSNKGYLHHVIDLSKKSYNDDWLENQKEIEEIKQEINK